MEICQQTNETATVDDETPEQLVPVPKSKCSHIARRVGIILLALIKLVLSWVILVNLLNIVLEMDVFLYPSWLYTILISITISINAVDMIIGLVIIISICLKNGRIMKMYYINSTCVFGSLSFLCCMVFYITFLYSGGVFILFSIFFVILMLQMYLNRLVKCEVLKLERSEEIQLC